MFIATPGTVYADPNQQPVQINAAVTTAGSLVFAGFDDYPAILVVNITQAPTGSSPTITYTLEEVDPGDRTTLIGTSTSTAALSTTGASSLTIPTVLGGCVRVSWSLTGGSPVFPSVYATLFKKKESDTLTDDLGRQVVVASAAGSAITSVASTASNVELLASNANRAGATIYNQAVTNLYAKLGTTASLTSYTVKMTPGAYYEVPFGYTGEIDGIWDVLDSLGAALITELT